jgi:hypothetical protein
MNDTTSHPELAFGPNPFFERLAPYLTFGEMPAALERSPLEAHDLSGVEFVRREALLEIIESHFVPTRANLEICAGLQILVRRALILRNPTERDEKKRMNQIGSAGTMSELTRIATLDGAGMLVDGVTGMGKTAVIRRVLEVLVPQQVVTYGDSPTCDWHRLTQCYYLYVDQPSNGTRGGLLKRILMELDKQVGTSYFEQHKRTTNLDTLLVVVCKLVSSHRVAVLVIDENQEANLADSPWAVEFVMFYHLLLNLGVSVLLAGNPNAFDHLRCLAQVMRRFSKGGVHRLRPAEKASKWWVEDLVPGVRRFDLVEKWDVNPEWRADFEFQYTAGLPGAYVALHTEAMRFALRRSTDACTVSEKDFHDALVSPRYCETLLIVKAINGGIADLPDYTDLPVSSPVVVEGAPVEVCNESAERPVLVKAVADELKRRVTAVQTRQTKELNALKKGLELAHSLSSEDVRMQGISAELLESMEEELSRHLNKKASSKSAAKSTTEASK